LRDGAVLDCSAYAHVHTPAYSTSNVFASQTRLLWPPVSHGSFCVSQRIAI